MARKKTEEQTLTQEVAETGDTVGSVEFHEVVKYSDEPDEYQLKSDPNIDKEFETLNFQRCFIEIFIRQYWKWMNGDFKYEPTQVIQAKQDWMGDKIGCLAFFQEEYEITNNENEKKWQKLN